MDKAVLNRITESVRVRGLTKYMTHDMISKGIFSKAFSSGSGSAESWRDHLTNRDDNDLVAHLYCPEVLIKTVGCGNVFL